MELTIFGVFFILCGVIVNENADAAENESTLTSMAVFSSTASAVSSVASSTGYAGTTQTPSVSTSTPLPCQHDRWLVSFKEDPQQYCIIMQADISVTIYAENKTETTVHIRQNATSSGSCENSATQILNITDSGVLLEWTFHKSDDKFNVTSIAITYNKTEKANIDLTGLSLNNLNELQMYQCNAEKTANDTKDGRYFTMTLSNLRLEAFHNTSSPCDFDKKYDMCKEDETVSNLVPIIVGACLGGLIVIVLIAYLVGRRRSRRGYESV